MIVNNNNKKKKKKKKKKKEKKRKENSEIEDFDVPADPEKLKESKKKYEYLDLKRELENKL